MTAATDARNPARPAASRIVPGICSVTFRSLDVPTVVGLVADAGLRAIEWGGDVHVPVGDLAAAERARALCAEKGVDVASYGSYWRADTDDADGFRDVVRTAAALGAPGIRVWAGAKGSAESSADERAAVVRRLAAAVGVAAEHGITVSTEYHRGTLTDTPDSAAALLRELPGLCTYWQPAWWPEPTGIGTEDAAAELALLDERLTTVHVFSWQTDGAKLPLSAKEPLWSAVFDALARRGLGHYALLEFVAGDSVEAFREDAATFLELLRAADEYSG